MNACFDYFNVVSRNASILMSHVYYFGIHAPIALHFVIRCLFSTIVPSYVNRHMTSPAVCCEQLYLM